MIQYLFFLAIFLGLVVCGWKLRKAWPLKKQATKPLELGAPRGGRAAPRRMRLVWGSPQRRGRAGEPLDLSAVRPPAFQPQANR